MSVSYEKQRKTLVSPHHEEFPGCCAKCRDRFKRCGRCVSAYFFGCSLFTMLDRFVVRRYILRYAVLECLAYLPMAFFFFLYKPVSLLGCCRQWWFILVTGFRGALCSTGIAGAALRSTKLMRCYLVLVMANFAIAWPLFAPLWRSLCTCTPCKEAMAVDGDKAAQCRIAYAFEGQSWCHAFEPRSDSVGGRSSLLQEGTCNRLQDQYCPEREGAPSCWNEIPPAPLSVLLDIFRQPWWRPPHDMIPGSRRLQRRSHRRPSQIAETNTNAGVELLTDSPSNYSWSTRSFAEYLRFFNVSEPGIVWQGSPHGAPHCYERAIEEATFSELLDDLNDLQRMGQRTRRYPQDSVLRREIRQCSGDKACGGLRLNVVHPARGTPLFGVCRYNLPAAPTFDASHLRCALCLGDHATNASATNGCSSRGERSVATCHFNDLSLRDLSSPERPRPWAVDVEYVAAQRHRVTQSVDCQSQLRTCSRNRTVFLHKFGGNSELLLPDAVTSNSCRIIIDIMMISLCLLNSLSVPMVVIVAKFISSRCGDAIHVETQFEVEFSDDSSGDDFDPLASTEVAQIFQTVSFTQSATLGKLSSLDSNRSNTASARSLSLSVIESEASGRLSLATLPQASPRASRVSRIGSVPTDWGGTFVDGTFTASNSEVSSQAPQRASRSARGSTRRSTRRDDPSRRGTRQTQDDPGPASAQVPQAQGGWWSGWFAASPETDEPDSPAAPWAPKRQTEARRSRRSRASALTTERSAASNA